MPDVFPQPDILKGALYDTVELLTILDVVLAERIFQVLSYR
jgi:hypothetical protein